MGSHRKQIFGKLEKLALTGPCASRMIAHEQPVIRPLEHSYQPAAMEQMRNLLRSSTTATGGEGSEISTPRSSLSSSHRATPSFNDLSFGTSVDGASSVLWACFPFFIPVLTRTQCCS